MGVLALISGAAFGRAGGEAFGSRGDDRQRLRAGEDAADHDAERGAEPGW